MEAILQFELFNVGEYSLTLYALIKVVLMIFIVKLILWAIKNAFDKAWSFRKLDLGSEYALFKIVSYLIWIIAVVLILEMLGVKITILIAGSAALMVGVGLGLQQTFTDIISGIILLFEGSTKVNDILSVDGTVVRVEKIGLRTSKVKNRDDVTIIIPNSQIVTNKVVNWSHQQIKTRFHISVGVAYGSDVDLVMRLLEESATKHKMTSKSPKPEARFVSFGDSSLDFELLFWSKDIFRVERAMSDIRRTIDRKFRENDVSIPFPQMDLHLKSN